MFRVLAAFNLNCVRSMGLRQPQKLVVIKFETTPELSCCYSHNWDKNVVNLNSGSLMFLCIGIYSQAGRMNSPDNAGNKWFIPECVARVPVSLWGSGG